MSIVVAPVNAPACLPIVCNAVQNAAGSAAQAATTAIFASIQSGIGHLADWSVTHVMALATSTTQVNLGEQWLATQEHAMLNVTVLVVLPLLLVATIGAVLHQDLRRLGRIWGVSLPVAVVGAMGAITFTQLALRATDALCLVVSGDLAASMNQAFDRLPAGAAQSGDPAGVSLVVLGVIVVGAVMLWLELVVRTSAVYIAVFFLPVALAGLVWPTTARMAKRLVEVLVALILSKFVIVATLSLGAAAVGTGTDIDSVVEGAAMLLMAAFAPFALLRLVPLAEVAAVGHLEGLSRRPGHAASRAATTVATAPAHPVVAALRSSSTGRSGGPSLMGPSAVVAQAAAPRAAAYDASAPSPAEPVPSDPVGVGSHRGHGEAQ